MTEEENKTFEENSAAVNKRLKTFFGEDGKLGGPCDNKCGRPINVKSFSVFVTPKYEFMFVCRYCAIELYHKHNYGKKN